MKNLRHDLLRDFTSMNENQVLPVILLNVTAKIRFNENSKKDKLKPSIKHLGFLLRFVHKQKRTTKLLSTYNVIPDLHLSTSMIISYVTKSPS